MLPIPFIAFPPPFLWYVFLLTFPPFRVRAPRLKTKLFDPFFLYNIFFTDSCASGMFGFVFCP